MPNPLSLSYSDLSPEQNASYNLVKSGQDYNLSQLLEQYARVMANQGIRNQMQGEDRTMLDWKGKEWRDEQARAKRQGKKENTANIYGGLAQFASSFIPYVGSFISPYVGQIVHQSAGGKEGLRGDVSSLASVPSQTYGGYKQSNQLRKVAGQDDQSFWSYLNSLNNRGSWKNATQ